MNNEEFMAEVDASCARSKRLLLKKAVEYAGEDDRLDQFYRLGNALDIPATSALIGLASKHFTSIADMAKEPFEYSLRKWNEKLADLRNYTLLLDALLRDMGIG